MIMKNPTNTKTLLNIMSYKRNHGSETEAKFIKECLPEPEFQDECGNMYYEVGEGSETLFVAHIDTVHNSEGMQKVVYDANLGLAYKDDGEPLGADDGAGVWMLLNLMWNNVPGTYILTRGEERGGIGAKFIAKTYPDFLAKFKRAIAFDRKGTDSIITSQWVGTTCSRKFAEDFARKVNPMGFKYGPDDTGVYTDTADLANFVPECTNISIGYMNEHSGKETLNVKFAERLRDAMIKLDWESLVTSRDPFEDDPYDYALHFTIVEGPKEYNLYSERGDWVCSHHTAQYLEGYAACMAEYEGCKAEIQYESELDRRLMSYGYDLDELDADNPYNDYMRGFV